jgi:hypothetical protein
MWPGFHSPGTFEFLRDAGAALEIDNLRYARQISRGRGGALDRSLVCAEQGRLQRLVRTKEMQQPQEWQSIRRELNGWLNHARAAPFLWRWCEASVGLSEVLREIRGPSRLELDFANEWHRILIGLKLIEHVRAMSASAYGASGRYLQMLRCHRNTFLGTRSAQNEEHYMPRQVTSLTLAEARSLISAGEKKAGTPPPPAADTSGLR